MRSIALLSIALFLLISASFGEDLIEGYCTSYPTIPGSESKSALCAPFVGTYSNNVFFFHNQSVSRAEQQATYVNNLALFESFFSVITDVDCRNIITAFTCRNLFAECITLNYTYGGQTYQVVTRRPICRDVCDDFATKCRALLTNPLVRTALAGIPEVAPFMVCNENHPGLNERNTFPASPGWTLADNSTRITCRAELAAENPTSHSPSTSPTSSPSPSRPSKVTSGANLAMGASIVTFLMGLLFI